MDDGSDIFSMRLLLELSGPFIGEMVTSYMYVCAIRKGSTPPVATVCASTLSSEGYTDKKIFLL